MTIENAYDYHPIAKPLTHGHSETNLYLTEIGIESPQQLKIKPLFESIEERRD